MNAQNLSDEIGAQSDNYSDYNARIRSVYLKQDVSELKDLLGTLQNADVDVETADIKHRLKDAREDLSSAREEAREQMREDLQTLDGIGEKTAEKLVRSKDCWNDFRASHGNTLNVYIQVKGASRKIEKSAERFIRDKMKEERDAHPDYETLVIDRDSLIKGLVRHRDYDINIAESPIEGFDKADFKEFDYGDEDEKYKSHRTSDAEDKVEESSFLISNDAPDTIDPKAIRSLFKPDAYYLEDRDDSAAEEVIDEAKRRLENSLRTYVGKYIVTYKEDLPVRA